MRCLAFAFSISLLACSPQSGQGPSAPEECVDAACPSYAGSSDQSSILQLESSHTSSRDILITWSDVPGVSDFSLDIADDESCQSVRKSIAVSGLEAHLMDWDEGVWYLCLKTASGVALSRNGQALVVDRTAPVIEGSAEQTVVSGDSAVLTVKDLSETGCSWSSDDPRLKIMEPETLLSPLTIETVGRYQATLVCEDKAGNDSSLSLILNMRLGEAALGPPPADISGLMATAGVNLVNLSWSPSAGAPNYLVLASTAPITVDPVPGMLYSVGTILGSTTVKAFGSGTTLSDTGLPGNSQRYYKVFAASSTGRYAAGVEVNATVIANKVLKTTLTRNGFLAYGEAVGLRTVGNYNYICRGESGLAVVDVSNPNAPLQVALVSMGNSAASGWCSDVKIAGNYAYVADWDKGLVIIDISNPAAPVQRGAIALTNASVVFVEGTSAYVAVENNASGGGLAIINVTNPAAPTQTSFTGSLGHGAGVSKIGNFVYLTHRDTGTFRGLKVYDVSNPVSPSLVRTLSRASMEDIDIRDNHAYITIGNGGIEIFDVSTPNNPLSRSTIATPGNGEVLGVSTVDNYAFITDYTFNKMYVIDVSNKTAPSIVRTYTTAAGCLYVHVAGGFAYLSVEGRGFETIEVFQFL